MRRLVLAFNGLAVLLGAGTFGYLLFRVDVTQAPDYLPLILIGALMLVVWGLLAYLSYGIRFSLFREHSGVLLWRSERQALLLALLLGTHLTLQGFLLWNIFSASILTFVIIFFEYYFLSQETTSTR